LPFCISSAALPASAPGSPGGPACARERAADSGGCGVAGQAGVGPMAPAYGHEVGFSGYMIS